MLGKLHFIFTPKCSKFQSAVSRDVCKKQTPGTLLFIQQLQTLLENRLVAIGGGGGGGEGCWDQQPLKVSNQLVTPLVDSRGRQIFVPLLEVTGVGLLETRLMPAQDNNLGYLKVISIVTLDKR